MKKLDKVILVLFSVIIFLESILIICMMLGVINYLTVGAFAIAILCNVTTARIILVCVIVCLLASLKGIFFESSSKPKNQKGILMQNDNGKLLISKATIENIALHVVNEYENIDAENVVSEMTVNNELIINVDLVVKSSVIIKDVTVSMQNKIKDAIKKTSDLEVKEVNVRIKNIITEDTNKEL